MPLPAFLGPNSVTDSGSVVFHDKHGTLALDVRGIRLEFEFRSDGSGQMGTQFNPAGNTIKVVLTNFDNPLGASFEMTGIIIAGRPATIMFMIHTIGDSSAATRLLSYSLF